MTRKLNLRIAVLFLGLAVVIGTTACFMPSADMKRYTRDHGLATTVRMPRGGEVKVTFLGNTSLLFDDGVTQLMIDGFFSRHPLWKVVVSPGISTDQKTVNAVLDRAKVDDRLKSVFVAHSHYDHAFDAAYVVKKTDSTLYGSKSTLKIGEGLRGLRKDQMKLFEPGKELRIGKFTVVVLESQHSPPEFFNDNLGVEIKEPLYQPARTSAYTEGDSFDFWINHGGHSILVKASAAAKEGALDYVQADVLFLGVATLGKQNLAYRNNFYDQSVAKVKPQLVVPMHWDNFFTPLSSNLSASYQVADDVTGAFDFLIPRLKEDKIRFGIMQGYQSVILTGDAAIISK